MSTITRLPKTSGSIVSGNSLTLTMDFFSIYSIAAIAVGNVNVAVPTAADNIARIVEVIESRAQPVIQSIKSITADATAQASGDFDFGATAIPAAAATSVYEYAFAIEHKGAWSAASLATALEGLVLPFVTPFASVVIATGVNKNTSIIKRDVL